MFDLTMTTPLVFDTAENDAPEDTTLDIFFNANPLSREEKEAVMTALETNGEYVYPVDTHGVHWTLRIKDPR